MGYTMIPIYIIYKMGPQVKWKRESQQQNYTTGIQMGIKIYSVWGQVYLLPYVKITHTKRLNGNIELIVGWWNREIVLEINSDNKHN